MQPTVSPSSLPTCWLFSQATNQFIAQYITIGTLLFEDNFLCWLKKLSSNNKATFRYIIWFKTVSRLLFLFLSLSLTLTLFFSVSLSPSVLNSFFCNQRILDFSFKILDFSFRCICIYFRSFVISPPVSSLRERRGNFFFVFFLVTSYEEIGGPK